MPAYNAVLDGEAESRSENPEDGLLLVFLPLHHELFDALKINFLLALIPYGPSPRQSPKRTHTHPKPSRPSIPLLLTAFSSLCPLQGHDHLLTLTQFLLNWGPVRQGSRQVEQARQGELFSHLGRNPSGQTASETRLPWPSPGPAFLGGCVQPHCLTKDLGYGALSKL